MDKKKIILLSVAGVLLLVAGYFIYKEVAGPGAENQGVVEGSAREPEPETNPNQYRGGPMSVPTGN